MTAEPADIVETTEPEERDRVRWFGRTLLVAAAIVGTVIGIWFGLSTILLDLPEVRAAFPLAPYALDGNRLLAVAAVVAAGGDPYSVAGYLYPPLGALVAIPFAALGELNGLWVWFALKIGIVVWCAVDATRGMSWLVRAAAVTFVVTSTFVLDDLWLGNVSIAMAAAIYLAVSRDRPWAAIPLGIVVAAVAKPFLVPVLLWMIVFRWRSAVATVVTALVATGITVALLGPTVYREYLETLTGATGLDLRFGLGLSGVAPELLVPASIAVVAIFVVLLWASRDESSLLMWSLLIGLIAAPYVGHYSVIPVFAGIPLFARAHPSRTLLFAALVAPLALVALVPATILGLVIAFPTDVLRRFRPDQPSPADRSRESRSAVPGA